MDACDRINDLIQRKREAFKRWVERTKREGVYSKKRREYNARYKARVYPFETLEEKRDFEIAYQVTI